MIAHTGDRKFQVVDSGFSDGEFQIREAYWLDNDEKLTDAECEEYADWVYELIYVPIPKGLEV